MTDNPPALINNCRQFATIVELASFIWHVAGWLFSNGG
jgi:hypothetical protein